MEVPQPELHGVPPVIRPVLVPRLQVKVLPAVGVRLIAVGRPLQLTVGVVVVITGFGCTVLGNISHCTHTIS